jgi:predicted membrane protein
MGYARADVRPLRMPGWKGWPAVPALAVLGVPAFAVGVHDLLAGLTFDVRLLGGAFALAGAVMLGAAAGLLNPQWRQKWAPGAAVLAGALGFLLSLYLFLNQLAFRDGWRALLLPVWIATAALSLAAAWLQLRYRPARPAPPAAGAVGSGGWKAIVGGLSSLGITGTVVLSLLQQSLYWAQSSQSRSYTLSISQVIVDQGHPIADPSMHALIGRITTRNPSGSEVQILRISYALVGYPNFVRGSAADDDLVSRLKDSARSNRGFYANRYGTYGSPDVLQVGEVLDSSSLIEPAEEFTYDVAMTLPEDQLSRYPVVSLETTFGVTRMSSRQFLGRPVNGGIYVRCSDDSGTRYDECPVLDWTIPSPGWLWTMTRGDQAVESWSAIKFSQPARAAVNTCVIEKMGRLATGDNRSLCDKAAVKPGLNDYYGLGYQSQVTVLWLARS